MARKGGMGGTKTGPRKGRGQPPGKGRERKRKILAELDGALAKEILLQLMKKDPELRARVEKRILGDLKGVDVDSPAKDVFDSLNSLAVEDIWDNTGGTRDGYVDPYDYAADEFDGELEPIIDEMRKYLKLGMRAEARNCCMGIMLGLYRYDKESDSDFKGYAEGCAQSSFGDVLEEWRRKCHRPEDVRLVEEFARKRCPDWFADREKCQMNEDE